MAKKKRETDEEISDFLKDEDVGEEASSIEITFDDNGKIKHDWSPGNEKEYIQSFEDEKTKELDVEIDEDGIVSETKEEEEPKEEKPAKVEEPQKREKNARSYERIKELWSENKQYKTELEAKESQLLALQASVAKDMKARLEGDVERLTKDIQTSMEEQDAAAFAKANKELADTQSRLLKLSDFISSVPDTSEEKEPKTRITSADIKNKPSLSPAARDWLEGKEDFLVVDKYRALDKEVRKKLLPVRQKTFELANALKSEGYDPESPDFYDELDTRLELEFDFYADLASNGIDGVDFDTKGSKSPPASSVETGKPKESKRKLPVVASSSSASTSDKPKPTKIKISAEQMKFYEQRLKPRHLAKGMTEEQSFREYVRLVKENSDLE